MRLRLIAIVTFFLLAAGQPTWAQQATQPGDAAKPADTPAPPTTTSPEQPSDLYQARQRSDGDFGTVDKVSDPVAGALNPPIEPLATDKQLDPKD